MTKVELTVFQDGNPVPGFPFLHTQEYRQVVSYLDTVTDTVNYNNVLPSVTPTETVRVGLLLLLADRQIHVAINDSVPDEPFTLGSNRLFVLLGGQATHTVAAPFCRVRCPTNGTNLLVIAGLL